MNNQNAPEGATTQVGDAPAIETLAVQAQAAAGCQIYPPTSFQVCGVIRDKYNQMGGPTSFLLLPKSNELTNPGNTGKRSEFVGGNIYWSTATGAHPVAHEFLFKWGDHGYETGFLKYPKTDEIVLSDGVSRRQEFQGGHIYWSPLTGAHSIQGLIYDKWQAFGAEQGVLRFPTSDEIVAPDGKGRFTTFEGGSIYWHPSTGAHVVSGDILDQWADAGYERSEYGYPTGEAVAGDEPNSRTQTFQNGTLYTRPGMFQGVIFAGPAPGVVFNPGDVLGHHPPYRDPDLSGYGSLAQDQAGALAAQGNKADAVAVQTYFDSAGLVQAGNGWRHYYENTGTDVQLSTGLVDQYLSADHHNYPDLDVKNPQLVKIEVREWAVQAALVEVDKRKVPVKVIRGGTEWDVVSGFERDQVLYLGRFSMSSRVAVIARPGAFGQRPVQWQQGSSLFDIYDFAFGDDPAVDNLPQKAINTGALGPGYGVAKPYRIYGDGSLESGSGNR